MALWTAPRLGPRGTGADPFFSATFVLLILPLLTVVATGHSTQKRARKHARARAGAKAKSTFAQGRRKPSRAANVRGPYKQWDDHAMECALTELAECVDFKNPVQSFCLKETEQ